MGNRVLCYGVLGVDQILQVSEFPEKDGHARILSSGEYVGGEAANVAVTLSGLGVAVRLMGSTLGEDGNGDFFLREIRKYAIDTDRLDILPGVRTTGAVIFSAPDQSRSILGFFPDLCSRPLVPADLEGVSLLSVDPFLGPTAVDAARRAHEAGVPVFSIELSERHPLAEYCTVVINSSGFMRRHKMGRPSDVAVGLLKAGVQLVVVTRGVSGCTVYREDGSSFQQPAFRVPVQDTTGAGDGFRAGLIYSYLQGWTLTRSVQFASATAALTCCFFGGGGHVHAEEEVLRLMG